VFPSHYPTNEKLYYAGFEVLILKNPAQVVVLGIEDGPASRAGVHWGDTIVSVDGVDPRNKSVTELESLFSSETPAKMNLEIERDGVVKTYLVKLAQARQVLHDNGTRLFQGSPIPASIPEKYLRCFAKQER
jgi:C-terminal processing protease CtpA/Prc